MDKLESAQNEALDASMPSRYSGDLLWHYTDAVGALGIINSGKLRASSISLLNDSGEMTHGMEGILRAWDRNPKTAAGSSTVGDWITRSNSKLREAVLDHSFVASATKSGIQFPLFLQYGSYALGFNPDQIFTKTARVTSKSDPLQRIFQFGWRSVIYENNEKAKHVAILINRLYGLIDDKHVTPHDYDCPLCWLAQECVIRCAAHLKDNSFAHEQEVRLYSRGEIGGTSLEFTLGEFGIVPYLEIEIAPSSLDSFPIEKVNIGPGLREPDLAKRGLEALLSNRILAEVQVEDVSGTYR